MPKVWDYICEQKVAILTPLLTAIIGVIGFWLSPLKQIVYDWLYPQQILMRAEPVGLRIPLRRGDLFIIRLHVLSQSGATLPAGEISVEVPRAYLELKQGDAVVDLNGTDKGKTLIYTFSAIQTGNLHLMYAYKMINHHKTPTADVQLTIEDRKTGFPTFEDLSGSWEFEWENSVGELIITEQGLRLTGTFSATPIDGSTSAGKLTGFAVQDNIKLVLQPNGSTTKIYANLLKVPEPTRLTICGNANRNKNEAFVGSIVDSTAPTGEICKGANLIAWSSFK